MKNKICTKCNQEKNISEFNFRKSLNKHQAECKICELERNRAYKLKNKSAIDEKNKKYRAKNKKIIQKRNQVYALKNADKIRELNREYRMNNKGKRNEKVALRKQRDPLFKLRNNISKLISKTFKQQNYKKENKTTLILGCSVAEFKSHIENQFEPWMNWQNYGVYSTDGIRTWQLDHIMPISLAKTEEEIVKLNHYSNFRPLESLDNIRKSNKII